MNDLTEFIRVRRIDSFQKLRLLIFLYRHPESSWTSREIAERLYLVCPETGKQHDIFGPSRAEEMAAGLGVPFLGCLPIDPEIARLCDAGCIEGYPAEVFVPIAQRLAEMAFIARRFS